MAFFIPEFSPSFTVNLKSQCTTQRTIAGLMDAKHNSCNHKNYNFFDYEWFKKTCQVVTQQLVIGHFVFREFNKPITFRVVVVYINQSHSKFRLRTCARASLLCFWRLIAGISAVL